MNVKLRGLHPGERFKLGLDDCVAIAYADSVGLNWKVLPKTSSVLIWFFNLSDNTVNYAAEGTPFEYLLDMEVELSPFHEGYRGFENDHGNPYNEGTVEHAEFSKGLAAVYELEEYIRRALES